MLYLQCRSSTEAGPKAISGRTSYLQVRLAFHPYPQLIRAFCNRRRCGPPRALTRASPWPWVAHLVSGRPPATQQPKLSSPCSDSVSLWRRVSLPQPRHKRSLAGSFYKKHAISLPPKGQQPLTVCRHTVSGSVSLPSPGCFSPFPHGTVRYRSPAVFSLGGWSPLLPTGFRVSRRTPGFLAESSAFPVRDARPLWWPVPVAFRYALDC